MRQNFTEQEPLFGSLSFLDIMALTVIAVSVITAMVKGLNVELLSLGNAAAGFYLAVLFYRQAARLFLRSGLSAPFSDFLGFASIFVLVLVVGSVSIWLVDRVLRTLHLKWMDRLLGGVFGLLRGGLIAAVIFLAFTTFVVRKDLVAQSYFAEFFLTGARLIVGLTPAEFQETFDSGYQTLRQFWLEQTN